MAKTDSTIGITTDDIKNTKDYTDALNKLQASLNGVNSALPDFTDGLQAGLKAVASKLPEVVDSMMKLNLQNKEMAANGQKPINVLSQLGSALLSWNTALSAGIALITAYGPKVLSFIANLFESDKARAAARDLKDYSDVLTSYIQIVSKGGSELKTLLSIAKNSKIAEETRIEAIQKLNNLSPQYLKTLTLANINTKEGTVAVDEYVKSLKRKAIEESAQLKTNELINERMKLTKSYQEAKQDVTDYRTGKKSGENFRMNNGSAPGTSTTTDFAAMAEKAYNQVVKKDADILRRMKNIDDDTAHKLAGLAARPTIQATLTGKSYWENELAQRQQELNKLDASSKNFQIKSKPIIERIGTISKTLEKYSPKAPKVNYNNHLNSFNPNAALQDEAKIERINSIARMAQLNLSGYAEEITAANKHFDDLKQRFKDNKETVEQLEKEKNATLLGITKKFQKDNLDQLETIKKGLVETATKEVLTTQQLAVKQLEDEYTAKKQALQNAIDDSEKRKQALLEEQKKASGERLIELQKTIDAETKITTTGLATKLQLETQYNKDRKKLLNNQTTESLQKQVDGAHNSGNWQNEFQLKQQQLDIEKKQAIEAAGTKLEAINKVEETYKGKQKKLDNDKRTAELDSQKNYLKGVSNLSTAVTSIFGKNTIAARVAFKAHQAASAGQVIIDTQKSIMGIWSADAGLPFIGVPKAIAETAIVAAAGAASLSSIIKQKPGFATGGHFVSDGKGALLSGYSRTDNTNAYLRSGEAVVVSEAMRNPWARNLVSAINVAHGGRDFSVTNPGRGYAIGGIFTDGGNSNRYYNQPMNDVKDLANTLAYQMINNFPPVYVDVKDINSQQSILAQTVNRVNL